MSFLIPLEQCQLPTRSTTISPSIINIKLDPTSEVLCGQQSKVVVAFPRVAPYPKPPLQPTSSHDQKCKKVGHVKKSLTLGTIALEVKEDSFAFSRGEEEDMEDTCTSSKGQFDRSQPNEQTTNSPLKKKKH